MNDWPALKKPIPAHLEKFVEATLRNLKPVAEGELLPTWTTSAGWFCIQYPWMCYSHYDFAAACEGQGEQDILRAYCLDWHATTGKKVLPEFSLTLHVATKPIAFDPDAPLYCGWDMPGCPAFGVSWLNRYGQWCLKSSVSPREDETIGVYDFGQRAYDHLLHRYCLPSGVTMEELNDTMGHWGDPAGNSPPVKSQGQSATAEARSCFEIIRDGVTVVVGHDEDGNPVEEHRPGFGWNILNGAGRITERLEALRARLRMTVADGLPAFIICPTAEDVINAFASYEYKELSDGRYDIWPHKNWASHTVDAFSYVATRLFEQPAKKQPGPRREGWKSRAASRYGR